MRELYISTKFLRRVYPSERDISMTSYRDVRLLRTTPAFSVPSGQACVKKINRIVRDLNVMQYYYENVTRETINKLEK